MHNFNNFGAFTDSPFSWAGEAKIYITLFKRDRCGCARLLCTSDPVARGTKRTQAALGGRPIRDLGESALAGHIAGAIYIKDQPLIAHSIPQAPDGSLLVSR